MFRHNFTQSLFFEETEWKSSYTFFCFIPATKPFVDYIKIQVEDFHLYLLIMQIYAEAIIVVFCIKKWLMYTCKWWEELCNTNRKSMKVFKSFINIQSFMPLQENQEFKNYSYTKLKQPHSRRASMPPSHT